ncbi:hypothetical protein COO20_23425 [Thalassospira marina]|uniref:Uncharacterized protein n=1 Tax=Thalassospira marina TaxID=2048283 RepID=A0A2N3KEC0_9PROT|nr:hypothetical protein COO20_23425 [Thalassospira marina]
MPDLIFGSCISLKKRTLCRNDQFRDIQAKVTRPKHDTFFAKISNIRIKKIGNFYGNLPCAEFSRRQCLTIMRASFQNHFAPAFVHSDQRGFPGPLQKSEHADFPP